MSPFPSLWAVCEADLSLCSPGWPWTCNDLPGAGLQVVVFTFRIRNTVSRKRCACIELCLLQHLLSVLCNTGDIAFGLLCESRRTINSFLALLCKKTTTNLNLEYWCLRSTLLRQVQGCLHDRMSPAREAKGLGSPMWLCCGPTLVFLFPLCCPSNRKMG